MNYNQRLFTSLINYEAKYNELNKKLEDPNCPVNTITTINIQLSKMHDVINKFKTYKKYINDGLNDEKLLATEKNEDLINLAKMELEEIKNNLPSIEKEIQILLLPEDPYDNKNVIIEIRPAAGGDESSIFSADLFETYKAYCRNEG